MDNFKFNLLSRGQLESLNLAMLRGFFGNLVFATIARMLCGNHLNPLIKVTLSFLFLLIHFADGLLCFNIRINELDDYQGVMSDLEKTGKWSLFSKKTVPYFAADDMPKETLAFVYKVLKK